jgi:hypothetical protein
LKETKERFDAAGVKLIAVGVGTPDKARILAERVRNTLQFTANPNPPSMHSELFCYSLYFILDRGS